MSVVSCSSVIIFLLNGFNTYTWQIFELFIKFINSIENINLIFWFLNIIINYEKIINS